MARSGRGPGFATRIAGRRLKRRVAGGKTPASARWLTRHLNDPYVAEARRRGYRSRAALKLVELDDRFRFLRPGRRVVDLGAAPGGWSQVAAERVGAAAKGSRSGRVVALDPAAVEPLPGVVVLDLDVADADAPERVRSALGGAADAVLSDMAAPATGHAGTDALRALALAESALAFAERVLAPGGVLVVKLLRGSDEAGLVDGLKRTFTRVRHVKPAASRSASREIYVVALGFGAGDSLRGRMRRTRETEA